MAYASASTVAGYTKNLLGPDKIYTESSCPTLNNVESWLSSGCSVIETVLAGAKYSTPVPTTSGVYGWVSELNALWAAAHAEWSRTNVTLSPGERTRGQVLYDYFWSELEKLILGIGGNGNDLTLVGLTRTSVGKLYVGGISYSDKHTWESDSDRVKPFAFRGMGRFPGTIDPQAGNGAS